MKSSSTHFILKKLFQYLFVIIGCLHLLGGPYSMIQLYAWANMVVTYSQESSLVEAVTDTFSGDKPCDLCVKISEVESSAPEQQTPESAAVSQKLFQDLFAPGQNNLREPCSSPLPPIDFPAVADAHDRAANGPLVPPPRLLLSA